MLRSARFIVPWLLVVAAACGGGQNKSAEPAAPAAAPDAKKVDPATAGDISGKVLVEGQLPPNPPIKMGGDPACNNPNATAETYVASNGALENVFVYIKDGLGNKYIFDTPTEPVKLDQKGCHYVPHVVGARATQPLEISNSDATLHNVHGMPKANREFNQGQAVQGLSGCMAEDLRNYGIRVSTVCPGSVATEFSGRGSKDASKVLTAHDVAHAVTMIATQGPQSFLSEIQLRPVTKP